MPVHVRHDKKRGCGWRKPGGLYLVSDGISAPCGRLPIPVKECPCCGAGIKPSRGWTWIQPRPLFAGISCEHERQAVCRTCPLHPGREPERAGLLWIGGEHYPTPHAWTEEAKRQGVSRRIPAVPKNFVCGETWVLVAHREAYHVACPECQGGEGLLKCEHCKGRGEVAVPAIFHAFRPRAVEYVVTGYESEDTLARNEARGITNVKITREGE